MRCIVTAGPTAEPLDQVRRLTNLSTGRLGSELASFLSDRGHHVTLLIGQHATWRGDRRARLIETFTTTADLLQRLRALAERPVDAVFHAAAVSDFAFGRTWRRTTTGELSEIRAGKISTRLGVLLAELLPTPKIIAQLRGWFPKARLVGWKYEVDGDRSGVILLARRQIAQCLTDACVANGPAYGAGFGLVRRLRKPRYLADAPALFQALEQLIDGPPDHPAPSSCG
jgi:phosphopantothenoylcysteine decarboxylase/phosphopantothenate--cysteine ligase